MSDNHRITYTIEDCPVSISEDLVSRYTAFMGNNLLMTNQTILRAIISAVMFLSEDNTDFKDVYHTYGKQACEQAAEQYIREELTRMSKDRA